jgi:hypothetical protein
MASSSDPRLQVDDADAEQDNEPVSKSTAKSRLEEDDDGSSGADSSSGTNSRFLRVASADSDSYISDADENGKKENLEELSK